MGSEEQSSPVAQIIQIVHNGTLEQRFRLIYALISLQEMDADYDDSYFVDWLGVAHLSTTDYIPEHIVEFAKSLFPLLQLQKANEYFQHHHALPISSLAAIVEDMSMSELTQMVAIRALDDLHDPQAIPIFLHALGDFSFRTSKAAEIGLINLGEAAASHLIDWLGDTHKWRRNMAIRILTNSPNIKASDFPQYAKAVPDLIFSLHDKEVFWQDQRICDLAAEALRKIATPEALAAVEHWQSQ